MLNLFRAPWSILAGVIVFLAAGRSEATEISVSTALMGDYVARGLTYVNRPVFQPDLSVTHGTGRGALTVGAWSNVEIGQYADVDDLSLSGGASSWNPTEIDPYAEIALPVGPLEGTLGIVGYLYPQEIHGEKLPTTAEIYGSLELGLPVLSPRLSLWYDFMEFDGAYAELGVSQGFPLLPVMSMQLDAAAGFSLGQGSTWSNTTLEELGAFGQDGLTHMEIGLSLPVGLGAVEFAPVARASRAFDGFTRAVSPLEDDSIKFWGGVELGWSREVSASH